MAEYVPVTADTQTDVGSMTGWSFTENGADPGAEARVLLRDGGAAGAIIVDIRLAAKQCVGESYPTAILVPGTVYVDVAEGDVRGAVYGG